jgi:hypothetical protein
MKIGYRLNRVQPPPLKHIACTLVKNTASYSVLIRVRAVFGAERAISAAKQVAPETKYHVANQKHLILDKEKLYDSSS